MSYTEVLNAYNVNMHEESLNLIKAQNEKIKELFNEIDKKDSIIKEYEYQKQKPISFEDKEKDFESQIANINFLYQKEIKKIEDELNTKTLQLEKSEKELSLLRLSYKDKDEKFDKYEKDNKNYAEKINKYILNEKNFQSRARELVAIIEKQDNEIKRMNNSIDSLNTTINNFSMENGKLQKQLNDNLSKIKELENLEKDKENMILSINNQMKVEKNKSTELINSLNCISKDNSNLRKRLDEAITTITEGERAITLLSKDKSDLIHKLDYEQRDSKEFISKLNESIHYISTLIMTSLKWADTYIGIRQSELNKLIPIEANSSNVNINQNQLTNILYQTYENINQIIHDIYQRVKDEYSRYDKSLDDAEDTKQRLIVENENLKRKISELNDGINKFSVENGEKHIEISEKQEMLESLKYKVESLTKINSEYEEEINKLYIQIISFIEDNKEKLEKNESFINAFSNVQIDKPNKTPISKLDKISEVFLSFVEWPKMLLNELEMRNEAINQYELINEECKLLKKEIFYIKKGYNTTKGDIEKEKENLLSTFEKDKHKEFSKLELEYQSKIDEMKCAIKERDDILEKLGNDKKLLYSQYKMSQKNFEDYKKNRKEYEAQLEKKFEEMTQKYNSCENERKKMKSEIALINVNVNKIEEGYKAKMLENEQLKSKVNELTKNTII